MGDVRAYIHLTVTITTPSLSVPTLAEYQTSLPEKTMEHRATGLNDKQIARVLKREGYRTPRGGPSRLTRYGPYGKSTPQAGTMRP